MSTTHANGSSTNGSTTRTRRNGKPVVSPNAGSPLPTDDAPHVQMTASGPADPHPAPSPADSVAPSPSLNTSVGATLGTPTTKEHSKPAPLNFDGPRLTPAQIVDTQTADFMQIIELDRALTSLAFTSTIKRGELYQHAIDAFKPTLRQDQWAKQRKIVINRGAGLFEELRNKKAFPHDDLRAFALYSLVSQPARDALNDDSEPLATDAITRLAELVLTYNDNDDTYTIARGLDDKVSGLIIDAVKAANQGRKGATADEIAEKAQTLLDSADAAGEAAAKERKARDRKKALGSMFARLAKFIDDEKVSPAELAHYFRHEGIDDHTASTVDLNNFGPTEAKILADILTDQDRAAEIHILNRSLSAWMMDASSRPAPSPRPHLNDGGMKNANPTADPASRTNAARRRRA